MPGKLKIFISYSRPYAPIKQSIEKVLLQHEELLFMPETLFTSVDEVFIKLRNEVDVFILLISKLYLESLVVRNMEVPAIMARADNAYILPVVLEECDWHDEPYGKYPPVVHLSVPTDSQQLNEIRDELLFLAELKSNVSAMQAIQEEKKNKTGTLNLTAFDLRRIPRDLLDMPWLKSLYLHYNEIKKIENLNNLRNLEYLDCSYNIITSLKGLENLQSLKVLDVGSNKLARIRGLTHNKLEELVLRGNQLSRLVGIGHLVNLHTLHVGHNKLQKIDELAHLPKLKKVVLTGNEIKSIRPLREHIKNGLKVFFNYDVQPDDDGIYVADNNTLAEPSMEVIERGHRSILKYFGDADTYGTKKLEILKLILVGNSTVGKTNFSEFLRDMPLTKEHNSTHVLDIQNWDATFLKSEAGTLTRMNIFDFGGQDYYHDSHRIYYSHDTAYVLIWDPTTNKYSEEPDKTGGPDSGLIYENFPLEYWLESISYNLASKYRYSYNQDGNAATKEPGNSAPVFVLQNKIDKGEERLDQQSLVKRYPNIAGFFAVSLQHQKRTNALFDVMSDYMRALNLSGRQLISYEHDIIEHYMQHPREFELLPLHHFCNECIQLIGDDSVDFNMDNARIIAEILNATGVMFYDASLGTDGSVFTQIGQLNNIIREVMQVAKTGNKKGIFTAEQLTEIPYKDEVLKLLVNNNSIIRLNESEFLAPQFLQLKPDPTIEFFIPAFTHNQMRFVYKAYFHKSILLSLFSQYLTDQVKPDGSGIKFHPFWRNGIFISKNEGDREMVFVEFLKTEKEGIINIKTLRPFNKRGLEKEIEETLDKLNAGWTVCKEISVNSQDFFDVKYLRDEAAQNRFEFSKNGKTFSVNDFKHIIEFDKLPKKFFISYSSQNAAFMKRFATHLEVLKQTGTIDPWYDRMIESGAKWDDTIRNEIKNADVIVFLLSPDFLATEYIMKTELPMAIEQMKNDTSKLFFIELKPCGWERTIIANYQQTDDPAKPEKNIISINTYDNDAQWKLAVNELEKKLM